MRAHVRAAPIRRPGWRRLAALVLGVAALGACGDDGHSDDDDDHEQDDHDDGQRQADEHGSDDHEPAHWSYAGDAGPEHWADLDPDYATCAIGEQQSPIDLTAATPADLPDPELSYATGGASVVDTGHSVMAESAADNVLHLDGAEYGLVQVHVHTPSEHAIDGTHAPAEAHFVHRDAAGTLAVVGVMLTEGAAHDAWQPYVEAIAPAVAGPHDTTFDWAAMLPGSPTAFRYDGSLTTPPCTEGVHWIVLDTPVEVSAAQLQAFVDAYDGNRRPLTERGDRAVDHDDAAG